NVHQLAHQVRVDPIGEVFQVQVQVIHAIAELGGKVIAQVLRIQVIQVGAGLDEGAAGFGHLLAVDGDKAMGVDGGRRAKAGAVQHGRPEQGVEINDVLADEVVELGLGVGVPVLVEVQVRAPAAQVLEAGHVADGGVEPDVEELAGGIGNLEAEVGRVAADIPFLQAGIEPLCQLVGDGGLQGAAAGPLLQE